MTHTLSRRAVLGGLPCLGMISMAPTLALATTPTQRDQRFVVVILRGAMDGLSAVAPVGDPDYAVVRGKLAIPRPGSDGGGIALDGGMFALHPALAPLYPMFQSGEMLVAHAMASPYRDRSHFDAQDTLENGSGTPTGASDGWLNRFLGVTGATQYKPVGFAVGSRVPLTLQGKVAVDNWAPTSEKASTGVIQASAAAMYAADPALSAALAAGQASASLVATSATPADPDAPVLPAFCQLAQKAGQLMGVSGGPNVATVEAFGWDTHVHQGASTGGLATQLGVLAQGLLLMKAALGPYWARTAVVVVTEFGRTAAPNGTGGTDHGTASAGFALGGAVAGGRVLANWPGLSKGALFQGRDLAPTLDIRSFLKGTLGDTFKLPSSALGTIFPNSVAATPLGGLIRSS